MKKNNLKQKLQIVRITVTNCNKNNVTNNQKTQKVSNKSNNIGFEDEDHSFELDDDNSHSFELK